MQIPEVIKSDVDFKSYRFIKLENGLRVMLISSLKPGETPEPASEEVAMQSDVESEHEEREPSECADGDIGIDEDERQAELRKSAAALCVNVGSFSDPIEAQGLAHFLEHMVFMGSEKYPRENDFDDYVSQRNGSSNACTDGEYTMFHFDIQRLHFRSSLDKFANFFVAPLLSESCVDRELEAVHSEFELLKANDAWRLQRLICSQAKENSPYRIFGCGNRISLRDKPSAAGSNVYEMLRKFQLKYYNAPLMTLAVESKDTLDDLQAMVSDIFGNVPSRPCKKPDLKAFSDPFGPSSFKKLFRVCPTKETISLTFNWSLPSMLSFYKASPLKFIGYLVGHEGKGSLLAYLRERNLAVELSAGTVTNDSIQSNQMTSLFGVSIELSELGREAPYTVASHVFSYLRMLRAAADFSAESPDALSGPTGDRTFSSLIPEYRDLCAAQFRFQEPFEPCDTVEVVSMAMLYVPPEYVYVADNLLLEPDLRKYVDVVRRLTPETAIVTLTLPEFNREAKAPGTSTNYLTEPWFGIRYSVEDIPNDQMNVWMNPPQVTDFHLPEVNRFITTNFALQSRENDTDIPRDLNQEPDREKFRGFGQLWHQQRTKFNVPVAHAIVHLYSNQPSTPTSKALLSLWSVAIDQRLQTLFYSATQASLHFSVSTVRSGLEIHVTGFNEKLLLLYHEIVDLLVAPVTESEAGLLLNPRKFGVFKDRLRQKMCNRVLNPLKLNSHIRQYLSNGTEVLVDDYMKAIEAVTLDDFNKFVLALFNNLFIKAYVYGNVSSSEAYPYFDAILAALKPTGSALVHVLPGPRFPSCVNRLRVMNFNKADVNACLALVAPLQGTPSAELTREVVGELFVSCLKEPAFAYLRTTETLGYSVDIYAWTLSRSSRQSGLSLVVCSQANKFDSCFVTGRMYAFWYRIIPQIIRGLSSKAFKTAVDAMIASNQMEDATMDVEVRRNKDEIFSTDAIFDRRQKTIAILQKLSLKDFQEFAKSTYLDFAKQPLIMLQVDANNSSGEAASTIAEGDDNGHLKTFDWPLNAVQTTDAQLSDEMKSSAEVDVVKALKACAAGLINTDEQPLVDLVDDTPVDIVVRAIADLKQFKTMAMSAL